MDQFFSPPHPETKVVRPKYGMLRSRIYKRWLLDAVVYGFCGDIGSMQTNDGLVMRLYVKMADETTHGSAPRVHDVGTIQDGNMSVEKIQRDGRGGTARETCDKKGDT